MATLKQKLELDSQQYTQKIQQAKQSISDLEGKVKLLKDNIKNMKEIQDFAKYLLEDRDAA